MDHVSTTNIGRLVSCDSFSLNGSRYGVLPRGFQTLTGRANSLIARLIALRTKAPRSGEDYWRLSLFSRRKDRSLVVNFSRRHIMKRRSDVFAMNKQGEREEKEQFKHEEPFKVRRGRMLALESSKAPYPLSQDWCLGSFRC